jgi:hypothetical protein
LAEPNKFSPFLTQARKKNVKSVLKKPKQIPNPKKQIPNKIQLPKQEFPNNGNRRPGLRLASPTKPFEDRWAGRRESFDF